MAEAAAGAGMRRARGLWPQVHDFQHLVRSAHLAARGKRDRPEVGRFLLDLEPNVIDLQRELREGTWTPGPLREFVIREPKVRRISAAPFVDRVVHHALCGVVGPVFDRGYIHDSYACRVGKGTHRALARARQFTRRWAYFLKLDIAQFFASIDHDVVRRKLARKLADGEILALFELIVAHGVQGDGRGLPIGNLTSQHLANLYLDSVDHLVKEELGVRGYVRYMDDMLLYADDKAALWSALARIEEHVEHDLRLRIKPTSVLVAPCREGVPFLGFRVFPGTVRVQRANWRRFVKRLAQRNALAPDGDHEMMGVADSVRSMVEFLRLGDTRNLRNSVLNPGPGRG